MITHIRTSFLAAIALLLLGTALPLAAQVDKVAMRTSGISCGECAAISEVYLRRLPGVDAVKISRSAEIVIVTYKAGASFDPWEIRDALDRTEVGVVQFQISARGKVQTIGGKRFFIADKNKFALVDNPNVKVPADTLISVEGTVNDKPNPMELKVLNFKPIPGK